MGKKKKNAGPRVSKNPNEYWEGEKLFVKTIKRSVCIEKHNNTYVLCCRIHQRGERQFDYQESACLLKAGNKSLYLTPTARQTIEAAVARFNAQIEEARNFYTKVDVEELGMSIYYQHNLSQLFNLVIEFKNASAIFTFTAIPIEEVMYELNFYARLYCGESAASFFDYTKINRKTIKNNPMYKSAVVNKDDHLRVLLKFYYHLASQQDCKWLEKILKKRVLPSLSKEYNKNYVIDPGTVDFDMISRSGYTILHRPYFAMMNYTHSKYQLNPHTKFGVDAAKKDDSAISFNEFLAMFDVKETNNDK